MADGGEAGGKQVSIEDIFEKDLSEVRVSNLPLVDRRDLPKKPKHVILGDQIRDFVSEWSCIWGVSYTVGQIRPFNGNQRTPWGLFRQVVIINKSDFGDIHAKFYLVGNDLDIPRRAIIGSHNFVSPSLFDVSIITSETKVVSYLNKLFNTFLKQCPKSP